jgi:site-specific recombinase XerC
MLQLYIGNSLNQGTGARTLARRLSHFRRFYQFLLNEEEIEIDPTQYLAMPKHWSTAKTKGAVTVVTWVRRDRDAYV